MAYEFLSLEYHDMHFYYGRANANVLLARQYYMDSYPNRNVPHSQTFTNVHRRLGECETFKVFNGNRGRSRTVRSVDQEETVLDIIDENLSTSAEKLVLK